MELQFVRHSLTYRVLQLSFQSTLSQGDHEMTYHDICMIYLDTVRRNRNQILLILLLLIILILRVRSRIGSETKIKSKIKIENGPADFVKDLTILGLGVARWLYLSTMSNWRCPWLFCFRVVNSITHETVTRSA